MCCFDFNLFIFYVTPFAQFRLIRFGFICCDPRVMRPSLWLGVTYGSRAPIAEFRFDLNCHVLRVQACWIRSNLDRTGYNAVDAGFWVVLELVIRWTRVLFNLIDLIVLSNVCSFLTDPDSAGQPHSVMLTRVRCAHERVMDNVCF